MDGSLLFGNLLVPLLLLAVRPERCRSNHKGQGHCREQEQDHGYEIGMHGRLMRLTFILPYRSPFTSRWALRFTGVDMQPGHAGVAVQLRQGPHVP